jgi:hypothetical protein
MTSSTTLRFKEAEMGPIRKFGVALAIAGVMAGGLGSATLEAKKKGGGDPKAAICSYLEAIMEYPYTSEYVLAWVISLYNYYGCDAQ